MVATTLRTTRTVLCVSLLLASAATPLRAQDAGSISEIDIAIVEGITQESLIPLAPGYLEWVRQRLSLTGMTIARGSASRLSRAELEVPPNRDTTLGRLQYAARTGAINTLLVDLSGTSQGLEIGLRLYDTATGELRAGRLTPVSSSTLAEDGNRALQSLVPLLGYPVESLELPAPATMDEITAMGRALRAFDRGELVKAWREISQSTVTGAQALRNEIAARGADPRTPLSERARLLAIQGDPAAAWSMIARVAPAELAKAQPDLQLLQAAGEVQAARGRLFEANKYFRHNLSVDERSAEATLGLAEIFAGQRDEEGARAMFERSAALDPTSSVALASLARSEQEPTRRAKLLILTGEREAQQLNPGRANFYFNRAAKIDPSMAGEAQDHAGRLYEQIGDADAAETSFQSAIEQGGATGSRLNAIARVQHAVGDYEAAQASYLQSLDLIGNDPAALAGLGDVYTASGQPEEAVRALEQASSLAPQNPAAKRSLARALTLRDQSGDRERASALFDSAGKSDPPTAQDLTDMATLQRQAGDFGGARVSLERAMTLKPLAATTQQDLVGVLEQSEDAAAALIKAQRLSLILTNASTSTPAPPAREEVSQTRSQRFDVLLQTFARKRGGAPEDVVLLGLQLLRPETWEDRLRAWIRPRQLDLQGLEQDLWDAVAKEHNMVPGSLLESQLPGAIAQIFRFASDTSLDPDVIAALNAAVGADAIFVAIATPLSGKRALAAGCESRDGLEIELRKLGGSKSYRVSALSNSGCLPASLAATGSYRWQAGALAGLLFLLLVSPLIRGWGHVVVDFQLPPQTTALFAVSLKRRPRKVKDKSAKQSGPSSWLFQKRLQSLSRYERRLQGKRISFRWIPARRRPYYLTVRGPLLDYTTEQIIGDFLEEKTVRVYRGKAIRVDFNMCPSEAAIDVNIALGGNPVHHSQVCLRGVAGSLRYAPEGSAFIYAGPGEHVVVVADGASVAEQAVEIETLDPIRLTIDLDSERAVVFRDCPEAVDPYMQGDFRTAADALEQAGHETAAHAARALWHRARGDRSEEARALAASGQMLESAELLATESDSGAAAELFEQAGEYKRAAQGYQQSGDLVAAARCYEKAYDYDNAVDCYRTLEDTEKVLQLLETTGDFFEAAKVAATAEQHDRALNNYQQVDTRHPHYSDVCREMGSLLAARGHADLAIEKFNEALELGGDEALSLELLERLGQLLEETGRGSEALEIYERVRRRDLNYSNISTKIAELKEDATRLADDIQGPGGGPMPAAAPEEARYEMIEELGRGGMGVVYKARDKHLGRLVAMKFLPDNLQQHPAAVKLFLREARATASLNHPNIVTMYDAAQQDGRYFISMECLEGVALDSVIRKLGPLPAKLLTQLGMQVCEGLGYAHRNKIVHRDIKPSNLFVTKERLLKIMDFGLAKASEEVRRNSTMIGGTPNFMAPEQAAGERVDQRTDLYSLGATLFQLVTATVPFEDGDVAYHHRHTPAPDAREREASVPTELAELLQTLMAKAPDDRLQSANEVGARLKAIFEAS